VATPAAPPWPPGVNPAATGYAQTIVVFGYPLGQLPPWTNEPVFWIAVASLTVAVAVVVLILCTRPRPAGEDEPLSVGGVLVQQITPAQALKLKFKEMRNKAKVKSHE